MQASLLFILSIALVFECSIIQDDEDSIIYNWSEFIRGESMTVYDSF